METSSRIEDSKVNTRLFNPIWESDDTVYFNVKLFVTFALLKIFFDLEINLFCE